MPVYRFRASQAVISGAPLSEPAQNIVAEEEKSEDPEKEAMSRIETQTVQGTVVYQEDEMFEWREVIRGMSIRGLFQT